MKRNLFVPLAVWLLLSQAGWAQRPADADFKDSPSMPPGAQGLRIQSLIQTLNSGDPERVRKFISAECGGRFRDSIPMEQHTSVFLGFRRQTGGVTFHGIRTYAPERAGETVVIVKDRNLDDWWGIVVRFGKAPGFIVDGLGINPARPPKNAQEPPLTQQEFLAQARDFTARLVDKHLFSGALLVARGDNVLLTLAAGEASKAYHVPNNVDTRFNLGSMNKMFTSTAIVQLAEKKRLSLDDPIGRYVDESWLPRQVTGKITIRHLLSHSSGLGSYFNETYQKSSRALFRKLDDYKPLIRDDRPAFEPGTRFQYSNTGMFLLGVVIEKVTGEDYFSYIRRTIYQPAGMTNTDCYEMDYPVENLATGYSPDPKSPYGWQNNLYKHVIKGGPAGGGFSTVRDLCRFAQALLGGKYVSRESLKAMWTDRLKANYGYGFSVSQDPAGKVVGHGGGFDGISSNLDIFVDSGFVVAVMSNVDEGAIAVARRLNRLVGRVRF